MSKQAVFVGVVSAVLVTLVGCGNMPSVAPTESDDPPVGANPDPPVADNVPNPTQPAPTPPPQPAPTPPSPPPPVIGPTTVTQQVRSICIPMLGDDIVTMKTMLIVLDSDRDAGVSVSASIEGALFSCSDWPADLAAACVNCTIAMIDHVYTH